MVGVLEDSSVLFRGFTLSVSISILFEAFGSLSREVIGKIARLSCFKQYATNHMTQFFIPKMMRLCVIVKSSLLSVDILTSLGFHFSPDVVGQI